MTSMSSRVALTLGAIGAAGAFQAAPHVHRPAFVRTPPAYALVPAGPEAVGAALHAHAAVTDLPAFAAVADATSGLVAGVQADGTRLTDEGIRALSEDGLGWWGNYINTVEQGIFNLYDFFQANGVPYPYGFSILVFVLGVKTVTLPLNYKQLSNSAEMKAMKPQQDLVKSWYSDNKDFLNMQTGILFEKLKINPLAGCLPSLAQIPVFLGVYYSVTSIARAKIFTEGFLWIPSLSGPIADRRDGISWLTEGWIDGVPRFGWEDTLLYLTIPAILVCTQTLSLNILGTFESLESTGGGEGGERRRGGPSPPLPPAPRARALARPPSAPPPSHLSLRAGDDNKNQGVILALRALPFMLGWFAMNAPAGLGLYWIFNNILTTTSTFVVKQITKRDEIDVKVDLAALGPRREPLPLQADVVAPDWTSGKSSAEMAADGLAEATGNEPISGKDVTVVAAESAPPAVMAAAAAPAAPAAPAAAAQPTSYEEYMKTRQQQ